ncbi:hypothetical protein Fcan01_05342, partial [Folsomia candida]
KHHPTFIAEHQQQVNRLCEFSKNHHIHKYIYTRSQQEQKAMALTKNLFLVAFLALASIQGSQSQETPGTDCTDNSQCNAEKFLVCVAEKCECDPSRPLYFDLLKRTCTLKLDQVCQPETEGVPTCSTGGSCKQDAAEYKCSCNEGYNPDGYNPDGDTRCVKVVDYDQSCTSDEEYLACREGLNVECNPTTSKCDCMGGYFVLADRSMCLAGFGTRCDSDPAGQPSSKCNHELFTECQATSTCGCPTTHMIDSLVTPPACALRLDQPCGAAGTAQCYSNSECKGDEGSKKLRMQ